MMVKISAVSAATLLISTSFVVAAAPAAVVTAAGKPLSPSEEGRHLIGLNDLQHTVNQVVDEPDNKIGGIGNIVNDVVETVTEEAPQVPEVPQLPEIPAGFDINALFALFDTSPLGLDLTTALVKCPLSFVALGTCTVTDCPNFADSCPVVNIPFVALTGDNNVDCPNIALGVCASFGQEGCCLEPCTTAMNNMITCLAGRGDDANVCQEKCTDVEVPTLPELGIPTLPAGIPQLPGGIQSLNEVEHLFNLFDLSSLGIQQSAAQALLSCPSAFASLSTCAVTTCPGFMDSCPVIAIPFLALEGGDAGGGVGGVADCENVAVGVCASFAQEGCCLKSCALAMNDMITCLSGNDGNVCGPLNCDEVDIPELPDIGLPQLPEGLPALPGGIQSLNDVENIFSLFDLSALGIQQSAVSAMMSCPSHFAALSSCIVTDCLEFADSCPVIAIPLLAMEGGVTPDCENVAVGVCASFAQEGCCLKPCASAMSDLVRCLGGGGEGTVCNPIDCDGVEIPELPDVGIPQLPDILPEVGIPGLPNGIQSLNDVEQLFSLFDLSALGIQQSAAQALVSCPFAFASLSSCVVADCPDFADSCPVAAIPFVAAQGGAVDCDTIGAGICGSFGQEGCCLKSCAAAMSDIVMCLSGGDPNICNPLDCDDGSGGGGGGGSGPITLAPTRDNSAFEKACLRNSFTDCSSCTRAGSSCSWCPEDGQCNWRPDNQIGVLPRVGCPARSDWQPICPVTDDPFSDPLYSAQEWVFTALNVQPVWSEGLTGEGITVRVNDPTGVDITHPELAPGYDAASSCTQQAAVTGTDAGEDRGTQVACIAVGAANNDNCAVGVAPGATLSACDHGDTAIASGVDTTDVSINSVQPMGEESIMNGIESGRDGKGIIYVFASGDDNSSSEEVEYMDGSLHSRYIISVGSVGKKNRHASYSKGGAALFISGPGSDVDYETGHIAAGRGGSCGNAGTSTTLANPAVGGAIALVLQANPELTWRDVQSIVAQTARKVDTFDLSWTTNDAGYDHSNLYGFGMMDAAAAVELAKTWENLPEEKKLEALSLDAVQEIPDAIIDDTNGGTVATTTITSTVTIADQPEFVIESVMVYLDFTHSSPTDLEFILMGPGGTRSVLDRPQGSRQVLTVRYRGEKPEGTWTLEVTDKSPGNDAEVTSMLASFKLDIFGHDDPNSVVVPPTQPPITIPDGPTLMLGETVESFAMGAGEEKLFAIPVAGKTGTLTCKVNANGNEEIDLYLAMGSDPSSQTFACGSEEATSADGCSAPIDSDENVAEAYALLYSYSDAPDVTIVCDVAEPIFTDLAPPGYLGPTLELGVASTPFEVKEFDEAVYVIPIAGQTGSLTCSVSADNGDVDLYVGLDRKPTRNSYDCSDTAVGSVESCTVDLNGQVEAFVWLYGFYTTTDVTVGCELGDKATITEAVSKTEDSTTNKEEEEETTTTTTTADAVAADDTDASAADADADAETTTTSTTETTPAPTPTTETETPPPPPAAEPEPKGEEDAPEEPDMEEAANDMADETSLGAAVGMGSSSGAAGAGSTSGMIMVPLLVSWGVGNMIIM